MVKTDSSSILNFAFTVVLETYVCNLFVITKIKSFIFDGQTYMRADGK